MNVEMKDIKDKNKDIKRRIAEQFIKRKEKQVLEFYETHFL